MVSGAVDLGTLTLPGKFCFLPTCGPVGTTSKMSQAEDQVSVPSNPGTEDPEESKDESSAMEGESSDELGDEEEDDSDSDGDAASDGAHQTQSDEFESSEESSQVEDSEDSVQRT